MNPWELHTWDPRSATAAVGGSPIEGAYEFLCLVAKCLGLGIELRLNPGGLSDIRLSDGASEDLHGLEDRDRAATVLLGHLRTERYI